MKSLTRAALAATGTAVLSAALVLGGAGAAQAYPASITEVTALVFNNGNVVDASAGSELEHISTDLESFGLTAEYFDGADGSAAAWSEALLDVDLLVIPEQENDLFYVAGGTPWVSDAALQVIKSWTEAGGLLIASGAYSELLENDEGTETFAYDYSSLFGGLTCLDFSGLVYTNADVDSFDLQVELVGAPDPLDARNGTYPYLSSIWPAAINNIATPIYTGVFIDGESVEGTSLGVGTFGVGAGAIIYLAYDWFEDTSAEWYNVLQLAASGALPYKAQPACGAPALANTGSEIAVLPIAGGAGILLLAGVLALVAVRRRTA